MQKGIRGVVTLAALPFAMSVAFAATAEKAATPAPAAGGVTAAPTLSAEDKAAAGKTYFERCAGCHGMLRKGATGKNLEPANTSKLGSSRLEKIMSYGTEGGMPNFDDILTKKEIANMAAYIQMPAEAPPGVEPGRHQGKLETADPGRQASDQADEQGQPGQRLRGHAA
jgi:nitrite reductase (NO-forming)/hydroxylamine reductase